MEPDTCWPVTPADDDQVPRPTCQLSGTDGNVFAIIGAVTKALQGAGQADLAADFRDRAFSSLSYDEVLCLCMHYVEVV